MYIILVVAYPEQNRLIYHCSLIVKVLKLTYRFASSFDGVNIVKTIGYRLNFQNYRPIKENPGKVHLVKFA